MHEDRLVILQQAIARNTTALLSVPHGEELRHIKSRFLGDEIDGIWLESMPHHALLIDRAIEAGKSAGVSFKGGVNKIVFASKPLRRIENYQLNSTTRLHAVLLAHPKQVEAVQRRGTYRVKIRPEMKLGVRLWRVPQKADLKPEPLPEVMVTAMLRDISVGGIGVTLMPIDNRPPIVSMADRLRIELSTAHGPLLLAGQLRYPPVMPLAAEPVKAGIQFQPDEGDFTMRQTIATLTRVVGELQREEIRRYRLGLMRDEPAPPEPVGA